MSARESVIKACARVRQGASSHAIRSFSWAQKRNSMFVFATDDGEGKGPAETDQLDDFNHSVRAGEEQLTPQAKTRLFN